MRLRTFGASVAPLVFVLAAPLADAQTLPPPSPQLSQPYIGFVSSYEIVRRVRTAGFDPLAPPLREGTTYVLRATDYRGILMRVVVDAHSGAIRDVTRIVPGPGRYDQFYGGTPYDPADYDGVVRVPSDADLEPPLVRPSPLIAPRPITPHPTVTTTMPPPLPRPRPTALASRRPYNQPAVEPKTGSNPGTTVSTTAPVSAKPDGAKSEGIKPDPALAAKPEINSEVITAAPPAVPAEPKKAPAGAPPLND